MLTAAEAIEWTFASEQVNVDPTAFWEGQCFVALDAALAVGRRIQSEAGEHIMYEEVMAILEWGAQLAQRGIELEAKEVTRDGRA